MESFVQPNRQLTSLEFAEELQGVLDVRERPELASGYAYIYRGVWTSPQGEKSDVAVKRFKDPVPKSRQTDAGDLREIKDNRIRREVYVWSRTEHPNLHPLLGYSSQPEPQLISPWCRHGNLADYLRTHPHLSRLDKLKLVYQAAYGLEHLHSRTPPISHADIKPENVLINDWREAALSDFGLSRVLHGLDIPSGFTTSETVKGTRAYMAGELFAGENPSCHSDVYAFGGLILTAMSGKPPFYGLSDLAIMRRATTGEFPKPEDHPGLPQTDTLWNLMHRCWDKSPAARPTMRQVLWELWELVCNENSDLQSRITLPSATDGSVREDTDMDIDNPTETQIPIPYATDDVPTDSSRAAAAATGGMRNSIAAGVLHSAQKMFKKSQTSCKVIPVFGKYVGAAAEVGLMLVEIVQTIDRNQDMASMLESDTWKLAVLLDRFQQKLSQRPKEDIASCIADIHREFQSVQEKVSELYSSGLFPNALSCCDHEEGRKTWEGMVWKAWDVMQLLINLNTVGLTGEFENVQLQREQRRLLNCLGDGKYGAQGNAIEDAVCLPGTRVNILNRMDNWIRDESVTSRVLWIRGMAGRGKSPIASTVAHNWKYRASCAIFHFRRGQSTLNARVVCALARQLGSSLVPEVKNAILESVGENEDIADQRLSEQFETLFVAPLAKLKNQAHPILVVVDALDEFESSKDAVHFVKLIDQHSSSFPINVKFLLTCRPEALLLRTLEPRVWHVEDLDSSHDVSDDLARFIKQACTKIRKDHNLLGEWPSASDVGRLVEMSQGLFQWARTAMTYIGEGSPANRLDDLLRRPWTWSELDDLYHQILSNAFNKFRLDPIRRELLCRILGTLVTAPWPVSLEVIVMLYKDNKTFEAANQGDPIQYLRTDILADPNSLLYIPTSPADSLRLMHTSIRDLLVNNERCNERVYYINAIQHHRELANRCIGHMLQCLKENMCNLSHFSGANSEIQHVIEREVSPAIRYSCRAWSIHLTEGAELKLGTEGSGVKLADFKRFSEEKLLYWLEVMSLVGATAEATVAARRVHYWLSVADTRNRHPST